MAQNMPTLDQVDAERAVLKRVGFVNTLQSLLDAWISATWWLGVPVLYAIISMVISTVLAVYLWTSSYEYKKALRGGIWRELIEALIRLVAVGLGPYILANQTGAGFLKETTPLWLATVGAGLALVNGLPFAEVFISKATEILSGYSLDDELDRLNYLEKMVNDAATRHPNNSQKK